MVDTSTASQTPKIGQAKVGVNDVLTPSESLTYKTCEELEGLINALTNNNRTRIILDCKSVSFIDSRALELMVKIHNMLKSRDGIFKITGLNPVCRDILLATRLINLFLVYDDIPAALRNQS